MTISIGQAALLALGYYLAQSPWLFGLAYFTFYRPLVAGTLAGIILGHPGEGVLIGATINLVYLGFISAGGSLPSDPSLAGWIGTAIAIAGGFDAKEALTIAVPIGLVGTLIFYLRMTGGSVIAHWADRRAEAGDTRGVALINVIPAQIWLFALSFIPAFLMALGGTTVVSSTIGQLPAWVINGLAVAGGILPAIGIAMNMRFVFRGAPAAWFFVGYLVLIATGGTLSIVIVAALGVAVAFLHAYFVSIRQPATTVSTSTSTSTVAATPASTETPAEAPRLLRRSDILRSWILWSFFSHANYNYERLQGTGFAHAMTPIINRLYSTVDERRAALQRHLVFFNTEPNFGNVIHGATIALEEQRAGGAPIDDDTINSVKSGLMGPIAGIGDTLSQGTIAPILLTLGIGLAGASAAGGLSVGAGTTGNILGPIVYVILISVAIVGIGYVAWMQGYRGGRTFVLETLRSGRLASVMTGASVLGNIVLGALSAKAITLFLAPNITIGESRINLQLDILDRILPGLLPLAIVMGAWWLLRRRVNPLVLLGVILAAAIIGSIPFFGPGPENANDYSYEACTSAIFHPYAPCTPLAPSSGTQQ